MNKKMLIGNIIGIIIIIGIVCGITFIVSHENRKAEQKAEQENIEQVLNIINDVKNTKKFDYSEPMKQEDNTYKVEIINKQSKKTNAYYIIDLEKKEYTLVSTGYTGKNVGDCTDC